MEELRILNARRSAPCRLLLGNRHDDIAKKLYGQEFADYLDKTYNPLAIVFRLASETGSVVLNGDGFDGRWSIRVSLANLNEDDYVRLGKNIRQILEQFADEWKASKNPDPNPSPRIAPPGTMPHG